MSGGARDASGVDNRVVTSEAGGQADSRQVDGIVAIYQQPEKERESSSNGTKAIDIPSPSANDVSTPALSSA